MGGRELAGVHATEVEQVSAFCAIHVCESIARATLPRTSNNGVRDDIAGKRDMCALLRCIQPVAGVTGVYPISCVFRTSAMMNHTRGLGKRKLGNLPSDFPDFAV
jgi:hypothetical protein